MTTTERYDLTGEIEVHLAATHPELSRLDRRELAVEAARVVERKFAADITGMADRVAAALEVLRHVAGQHEFEGQVFFDGDCINFEGPCWREFPEFPNRTTEPGEWCGWCAAFMGLVAAAVEAGL